MSAYDLLAARLKGPEKNPKEQNGHVWDAAVAGMRAESFELNKHDIN